MLLLGDGISVKELQNEQITVLRDGRLSVHVDTPRKDGRANVRVCELLARHLGVSVAQVSIVKGYTSASKVIRVMNDK